MVRKYNAKCKCRRWSMHTSYNILNLAVMNARILYKGTISENILCKDILRDLVNI